MLVGVSHDSARGYAGLQSEPLPGDDIKGTPPPRASMYKAFWHQYVLEHSHHDKSALTVNPGPLFAAMVCLIVLMAWAAFQMQSRCSDCREWPVRCRCSREHSPADRG